MTTKFKLVLFVIVFFILSGVFGAGYYLNQNYGQIGEVLGNHEDQVKQIDSELDRTNNQPLEITVYSNGAKSYSLKLKQELTLLEAMTNLQNQDTDFSFETQSFDFGEMLFDINGEKADSTKEFWEIKVNGKQAQVGISELIVKQGDHVEFRITEFN